MNNELKTSMKATTEIDLTGFVLTKRGSDSFIYPYIFEDKVGEDIYDFRVQHKLEEYRKIILSTKVYARDNYITCHLVPVANFKINDYWNVNGGKPIHCSAIVRKFDSTHAGKIAFTLQIHEFNNGEKIQLKRVGITKERLIKRNFE